MTHFLYMIKKNIKKDKKNNTYFALGKRIPKTLTFSKITYIDHCDTLFLNLVNYDWLLRNSWKENNPNILFKDLYFLLKINKYKYLKIKVVRVLKYKFMNRKLDYIFYINSILFLFILLLPVKYKVYVYSPSIIGWIWLISIPLLLISFLWASILDIQRKKYKNFVKRLIFFVF